MRRRFGFQQKEARHQWRLVRLLVMVLLLLLTNQNNTITILPVCHAWPAVQVQSREFKVMLDAQDYSSSKDEGGDMVCGGNPPFPALLQLQRDVVQAASQLGLKASGNFTLTKTRQVRYYDTPGDCRLRRHDFILRARRNLTATSLWQGTLKVRHGDRYYTSYRRQHLNQCRQPPDDNKDIDDVDAGDKFEEDITTHPSWRSLFSYSHSCWLPNDNSDDNKEEDQQETTTMSETNEDDEGNNKVRFSPHHQDATDHPFQTLQDVVDTWSGEDDDKGKDKDDETTTTTQHLFVDEFQWELDTSLRLVSNLQVTECVYKGLVVDFVVVNKDEDVADEDERGAISVTLWYDNNDNNNNNHGQQQPALAELSVKLKSTGRKLEDWNQETIFNAHRFWNKLGRLDQIDPKSLTKTAWVYNYDPDWCMPEEESYRQ